MYVIRMPFGMAVWPTSKHVRCSLTHTLTSPRDSSGDLSVRSMVSTSSLLQGSGSFMTPSSQVQFGKIIPHALQPINRRLAVLEEVRVCAGEGLGAEEAGVGGEGR